MHIQICKHRTARVILHEGTHESNVPATRPHPSHRKTGSVLDLSRAAEMRLSIRFGVLIIAILVAAPMTALAQNWPWCSSFHDGAGTNCGFSTYEQCMATARGSGGNCAPNNLYVAPRPAMASGHTKHKHQVPSSSR
jgi:Protein of unknown function (DUF3551)